MRRRGTCWMCLRRDVELGIVAPFCEGCMRYMEMQETLSLIEADCYWRVYGEPHELLEKVLNGG